MPAEYTQLEANFVAHVFSTFKVRRTPPTKALVYRHHSLKLETLTTNPENRQHDF